jgi:thymidylate synthase (FAD)
LERHRFVSLSVLSQRYVDESDAAVVVPPAEHADPVVRRRLVDVHEEALRGYRDIVDRLIEAGMPRKQAREAARSVLPNATETRFVVTANLRAWRDVLRRRWHVAADAEIRAFAGVILDHLRELAPNAVQDIPVEPYGGDA